MDSTIPPSLGPKRRNGPRRKEDKLFRIAIRALMVALVISVGGCAALFVLDLQHGKIARQARVAADRANAALRKVEGNYVAIQAQTNGACYRLAYLRWQDDKLRYAAWQRDKAAAFFLSRGISPAIKTLGGVFARAAASDYFLPQTDCAAAATRPTTYQPPRAMPFTKVDPRFLRRFLASPPQPPGS